MRISFLRLSAAALLATTVAAPAFAQDAGVEPFSGLYVAGTIGKIAQSNDGPSAIKFDRNGDGTFGDPVFTATGGDAFNNSTGQAYCGGRALGATFGAGCARDKDGFDYSARVGFDRQMGPFVVGVVGEFGKATLKDYVTAYSTTPASYTMERRIGWEASARLRAGYAANTTLFYATGGAGYAQIKNRFFTTNTANAFTDNGNSKEWGFVVGGGIEQKITQNISLGVEYGYHDYKDDGYRVLATRGTAAATNPFVLAPNTAGTTFARADDNFRWHSVKAVAAFRF
ncbi:outer membrane protein [Sphingomonas jatrophae]|uniref:Outer membrane immunogenic protein n=1 Tax=Sphingomonas jatrophae TaxID=1166337 RepID=A0A1I6L488_9SPHN|nr:outer membrane beta-barrel protein [Sphingomonas jatrophae]SFR98237.1 outer membrane immunogenic protein [Sphingomonas jatrophae]